MDLVFPGGSSIFDTLFSGSENYLESTNAVHPNATEDDLLNALAAMEKGDIEFVILQDKPSKTFLQTTGSPDEGYYLEYNDGADNFNYRVPSTLSGIQLAEAMLAFLNDNPSWKTNQIWEKFHF